MNKIDLSHAYSKIKQVFIRPNDIMFNGYSTLARILKPREYLYFFPQMFPALFHMQLAYHQTLSF